MSTLYSDMLYFMKTLISLQMSVPRLVITLLNDVNSPTHITEH